MCTKSFSINPKYCNHSCGQVHIYWKELALLADVWEKLKFLTMPPKSFLSKSEPLTDPSTLVPACIFKMAL